LVVTPARAEPTASERLDSWSAVAVIVNSMTGAAKTTTAVNRIKTLSNLKKARLTALTTVFV